MRGYDAADGNDWSEMDQVAGWFSQSEAMAMQWIVKQLPPGARVVELGSFQGRSSVVIASALPHNSLLYCIDHFKGSVEHQEHRFGHYDLGNLFASFRHNIEKFHVDDKICTLAMNTLAAADEFLEESVDMIFVDAAHDYEAVRLDILNWYPKLKAEGFLLFHDYNSTEWPGITEAIQSLQLDGRLLADSLWLHLKSKRKETAIEFIQSYEHQESEWIVNYGEKQKKLEELHWRLIDQMRYLESFIAQEMQFIREQLADLQQAKSEKNDAVMSVREGYEELEEAKCLLKNEDQAIRMKKRKRKHR